MRGIIMHDNGRLKTGRVSLIFFLGLVLGLGLLFHLHKPVDDAIVVVRHIFTATAESETPKKLPLESEKPAHTPQQEPVKVADNLQNKKLEEVEEKNEPPASESISLPPAEIVKDDTQKSEPITEKIVPASIKPEIKPEIETREPAAQEIAKSAAVPADEIQKSNKSVAGIESTSTISQEKPDAVPLTEMEPEELVVDYQQAFHESVIPHDTAVNLMSESARKRIRDNLSKYNSQVATTEKGKFKAVQITPKKSMTLKVKPESKVDEAPFESVIAKTSTPDKSTQTKGITVEKQEYTELHRAWRNVGAGDKENDQLIPLQIENLRSVYNFLQMKVVVIMSDNSCIDLSDGSRIPSAFLDRFSSTVIQVEDPWQKWGTELHQAGLRPGQSFEIRYYLYDFVKRSIYARVNQAFNWSLDNGLVKSGTKPEDVDVLGRAYVVKRSGGGSFGVFIPLSLATRDGRIINIDPVCFNNAPDVAALHAAGVI